MATTAPRKPATKPSTESAAAVIAKPTARPAAKKPVSAAPKAVAIEVVAPTKKTRITAAPAAAKSSVAPIAAKKPVTSKTAGSKTSATKDVAKTKVVAVEKIKKAKLVRDSFTMPETEYAALGEVKKACLKAGFEVKKSELLRIGVALVRKLTQTALKQEVSSLAPLKPGRPRKEKAA